MKHTFMTYLIVICCVKSQVRCRCVEIYFKEWKMHHWLMQLILHWKRSFHIISTKCMMNKYHSIDDVNYSVNIFASAVVRLDFATWFIIECRSISAVFWYLGVGTSVAGVTHIYPHLIIIRLPKYVNAMQENDKLNNSVTFFEQYCPVIIF